ncbi:MAG: hypothetical protein HY675_10240 [Chloroflexi bacterium]|nr:hypothetical protein [Chloroflexota bacterium]
MENEGHGQSDGVRNGSARRTCDESKLDRLISGLVFSVREMERENVELDARNSDLVSALEQANERILRLEQTATANRELTRIALQTAAEMLARAEEAMEARQQIVKDENGDRRAEATRLALELQKEVMSLMQEAREEALRRNQETERKALEILAETRESILSMADAMVGFMPEQRVPFSSLPPIGIFEEPLKSRREIPSRIPSSEIVPSTRPPTRTSDATIAPEQGPERSAPAPTEVEPGMDAAGGHTLPSDPAPSPQAGKTLSLAIEKADHDAGPKPGMTAQTFADGLAGAHTMLGNDVPHTAATLIKLGVSPIRSFTTLSRFHAALQGLSGILDTQADEFENGRLQLSIVYAGCSPLAGRLAELSEFNLRLAGIEKDLIEIVVEEPAE